MSNPHDYTVGWICAIHTEYVAALAFLDEKHQMPEYISTNDNNDYTLGKIGRHNVVIAVLPNGEYGLASAASVARDMLHSFPNVRIGLMVGIGSGAPSLKHDIRLGDVVVGVPQKGTGGIIQYDFGKAIQSHELKEMGSLSQPPTLLRTAVGGLMAQYETDGNQIRETVNNAIAKKPRLRKKYMRPEDLTDRLYRSHVVHPRNNEADCAIICGDYPSNLIERSGREEEEEDDPAIHYGLIASANTLMRNASVRDEMAKKGVLCFETEAAGLMNHFPCLVIRGICDYSDSHTNEKWHGYAAMTAAAYAKDLLSRITPNRVEAEAKISNILSGLYEVAQQHRDIAENHRGIAKTHREIAEEHRDITKKQLKALESLSDERQAETEQRCHQLFRLISGSKDATYEWYKNRVEERVEDTCLWFLNHIHYQEWLQQESGPLLVTADPGCGKSVLAKYLIDHGLPQYTTICYFFFKDKDQNTSRQALCALLHQLFSQKPRLIKYALPYFCRDGRNLINSTQSLWDILRNAIKDPEAGPIIIVLDALDECAELEFVDLMRNVESQFRRRSRDGSSSKNKLKYLITCRPYEQITSQFHYLLQDFPNIRIPGEEESESISREVNRVIIHRIKQLSEKKRFSPEINSYLAEKLQETTHRTYLWVHLVFNYLEENVLLKRTQKEIEMVIKTHPKSVNEAYEKILSKSEDEYMVRKALSIILAAGRPLTLSEMNIAMNINDTAQDNTTNTFDDLDLEDERDFKSRLRSLCGLFISVYQGKVYFFHQTAREFLLADLASPTAIPSGLHWYRSITTRQAHGILAELCVLYLNLFNSGFNSAMKVVGTAGYITNSNAFLTYAAENWGTHFREAHIADGAAIISVVLRICDIRLKSNSAWFTIYQRDNHQCPTGNLTDLIIASYYGHHAVVKLLVEKGADIEAKDYEHSRTALSWAAWYSHEVTIKLLVKKGADIDAKDKFGLTPLSWAALNGDEAITKLLVEMGADIKATDRNTRTPLSWAASKGHEAIARLLIEKGADTEAKDRAGWTPLLFAAECGQEAIVKLLVEKGADIEAKDENNRTPLLWALRRRHEAIAKLLINKGADVEVKDNEFGRTPLLWAAWRGYDATVKLLVEKGVNIEAKDKDSRTPLLCAAEYGHEAVIKLLLKKGVNTEAKDLYGRTPLLCVAEYGHGAIVKLLVEKGADFKIKDKYGWTPLTFIAGHGHEASIKMLIERGADTKEKNADGWTTLTWAAERGHEAIVRLLIEKWANIKEEDEESGHVVAALQ
ncbi:ankyrin repeat-containing domain protein [Trichoderma sp. SZMC 28015]